MPIVVAEKLSEHGSNSIGELAARLEMQFWLKAIYTTTGLINRKKNKVSQNNGNEKEVQQWKKWKHSAVNDIIASKLNSHARFVPHSGLKKKPEQYLRTEDINDWMPNETYLNK